MSVLLDNSGSQRFARKTCCVWQGSTQRLLVISNGHGEDNVAARLLKPLQKLNPALQIMALPMVGLGRAYQDQGIPRLEMGRNLPSGGFLGKALVRDIHKGLIGLTRRQICCLRQWALSGGVILAVGDVVPLLLAWGSGLPFAFVGTAKSEYGRADDETQWQLRQSVYWPWERWLMTRSRCRGVFPRDRITATTLKRWPIPVFDCGNPMMDDLEPDRDSPLGQLPAGRKVVLLPGSHAPEVFANWRLILSAVAGLIQNHQRYVFLCAIAPGIDRVPLQQTLVQQRWGLASAPCPGQSFSIYTQAHSQLFLVPQGFRECMSRADMAIAMAGTATEQAVGLGKPVITLPGEGPQFTPRFATMQARLLGPSVYLLSSPEDLGHQMQVIGTQLSCPQRWIDNGRSRMGQAGAGQRIAECLYQRLIQT